MTDYWGITPDVLSHPIIGQGYGSLDSDNTRWYRILDNEYLDELFQVGILGVLAYLAMVLAPLITAHGVIKRAGGRAPPIVAAAAGCAAYAVGDQSFHAMSFPQAPYSFFFVAGLIAAAATARDDDAAQAPALRLENLRRRVRHRARQRVGAGVSSADRPAPRVRVSQAPTVQRQPLATLTGRQCRDSRLCFRASQACNS